MPGAPEPPEPEAPEAPPPDEPAETRPLGVLVGVGAMLLVPAVVLALVLAYVPKLRPWSSDATGPSPSGTAEGQVPEGKVLLAGRVVDSEGEPVEGARVTVLGGNRALKVSEQVTGRGGAYSFELDPGRVVLLADHEDRGMVASAELMLNGGAAVRNLVLALAPIRVVRGVVTSEDGGPVAGASVKIEGPAWLQRGATSEADGSYRLARVPSLDVTLRAVAPGYAVGNVKLRAVGLAGEEVVNLRLAKESDVTGQVLDPDGKPVRAAVMACDGKEPGQRMFSSPEGKFKVAREFSRCPLVAYHDGYAASEPALAEGGEATLRLKPGGAIAGLVVDEGGAAVKAFYLGIESFAPSFGERIGGRNEARTFDDTGGAFLLDRLAPGSYVLSVGAEGRSPVRSPPVEVRAGQTARDVRVVLLRGGTVEGQVFDEERRSPLAAARISFDSTSSVRREGVPPVFSDDAGKFRLEGAPAGPFSLRVEHDGYRSRIVAGLKIASGEVLKQEIGLKLSGDAGAGLEFVGIGSSIEQTRDGLLFRSVFEGSPAEKAGLRSGDLLRRIDGQTVEGLSLADAIQRLRGEKGSQVRVTAERPPAGEFVEVTITRGEIVRLTPGPAARRPSRPSRRREAGEAERGAARGGVDPADDDRVDPGHPEAPHRGGPGQQRGDPEIAPRAQRRHGDPVALANAPRVPRQQHQRPSLGARRYHRGLDVLLRELADGRGPREHLAAGVQQRVAHRRGAAKIGEGDVDLALRLGQLRVLGLPSEGRRLAHQGPRGVEPGDGHAPLRALRHQVPPSDLDHAAELGLDRVEERPLLLHRRQVVADDAPGQGPRRGDPGQQVPRQRRPVAPWHHRPGRDLARRVDGEQLRRGRISPGPHRHHGAPHVRDGDGIPPRHAQRDGRPQGA